MAQRKKLSLHDLVTEVVPVDSLRPHPRNPRASDPQRLARSIGAHGQYRAIVVSNDGYVLAGNHTWMGACEDGAEEILIHRLPIAHDDPQALEIMVVDNKASDDSKNEDGLLAEILAQIQEEMGSLEATLFEDDEFERLMKSVEGEDKPAGDPEHDPDDLPAPPRTPITVAGDVWHMGPHRLICGDATDPAAYRALFGEDVEADLVFTSPPYNVDVSYGEHDDESADWPAYQGFLTAVLMNSINHLAAGRAVCWNIGVSPKTFPHRQQVLLEDLGLEIQRVLVWDKGNTPFPLWYASTRDQAKARAFYPNYQHELVVFASKGPLEKGGSVDFDETLVADVFQMGSSSAGKGLSGEQSRTGSTGFKRKTSAHPAAFPVALPVAFINHLADQGAVVLDPFSGSGSTIIACHQAGRIGYGIELDPAYCDVALQRWQEQTGEKPVRASDGEVVDFVNRKEMAA